MSSFGVALGRTLLNDLAGDFKMACVEINGRPANPRSHSQCWVYEHTGGMNKAYEVQIVNGKGDGEPYVWYGHADCAAEARYTCWAQWADAYSPEWQKYPGAAAHRVGGG